MCIRLLIFSSVAILGGCFSIPVVTDLEWQTPAILNKEGCPNIDGNYQDRALLNLRLADLALSDDLRKRLDIPPLLMATYVEYRKRPYQNSPANRFYELREAFYRHAVTSIRRQGRIWEIILMDGSGVEYSKTTLYLDHPHVGCFKNGLVIKEIESYGINESGCGAASTSEESYRKLEDGTLQITYHNREWPCRIGRGKPKESEGVLLFPPAP